MVVDSERCVCDGSEREMWWMSDDVIYYVHVVSRSNMPNYVHLAQDLERDFCVLRF